MNVRTLLTVDASNFKDDEFKKASGSRWFTCMAGARNEHSVAVHDTKDSSNATLAFTNDEWKAFVDGVKKVSLMSDHQPATLL